MKGAIYKVQRIIISGAAHALVLLPPPWPHSLHPGTGIILVHVWSCGFIIIHVK